MMAFETVSEATRLWIKGREFTVARLLGENYKQEADRYTGGALAIFRLAPQDYHRFHSPVEGTIGNMTYIAGEYYTVNVSTPFLFGYPVLMRWLIGSPKLSVQRSTSTAKTHAKSFLSTVPTLGASWLCALGL